MKKGLFIVAALCLCAGCSSNQPPKQTVCKGCEDHNYESHDVYYQGVSPWLGENKKNEEVAYTVQFSVEYEDGKIVHISNRVIGLPDDTVEMLFAYNSLHDAETFEMWGFKSDYTLKNDGKSADVTISFQQVANDTVVIDVDDVIEIK